MPLAIIVPLLLFVLLSWFLVRGAAVARHRSRFIGGQPLVALWKTIGHADDTPKDDFAIILIALVWFTLPAMIAVGFFIF